MKRACLVVATIFIFILAGCGESTIDGSSQEAFNESLQRVKRSLDEEEKQELEHALRVIMAADANNIFELLADPEGMFRRLKDKVDGKTAEEIIAEAERIRIDEKAEAARIQAKDAAEDRKYAEAKIAVYEERISELEQRQSEAIESAVGLKKFEVSEVSRNLVERYNTITEKTTTRAEVVFTVTNNTPFPVASARFDIELFSEGRSIAWDSGLLHEDFAGGVEPGESRSLDFSWEIMHEKWVTLEEPIITVDVVTLRGADREELYPTDFSDYDKERLEELKTQMKELQESLDEE